MKIHTTAITATFLIATEEWARSVEQSTECLSEPAA